MVIDMFGEQRPDSDWTSTAKPGTSPLSKAISDLNAATEVMKSIHVKKPVLRPRRAMTQADAAIGSVSMQERQKSKNPVRKAIEAVNELTKAIMRIPLTQKPDPKKPATRQADSDYKRPQYDRTFKKSDILKAAELIQSVTDVLKAMTAGSSATTGSNLMHAVADGATQKGWAHGAVRSRTAQVSQTTRNKGDQTRAGRELGSRIARKK